VRTGWSGTANERERRSSPGTARGCWARVITGSRRIPPAATAPGLHRPGRAWLAAHTRLRVAAARTIRFPTIGQLYDAEGGNPARAEGSHSRGSTGSLSSASTPNTHSCTRRSG
jgi:hypothetical protein